MAKPKRAPRIAIAGGGLCGLTLAGALAKRLPTVTVAVFERARADHDQGYGLDLDEHGHHAIAMAGIYDQYWDISRERSDVFKYFPLKGDRPLAVKFLPNFLARWVPPEPETNRLALREALLGVIEQSDSVTVSHEVAATSAVVHLSEDGSSAVELFDANQKSLGEFDLVVDASGLHSPLRHYRVESATKEYSGRILIHGLISDPESSAPALAAKMGEGTVMPIGRGSFLVFQRYGAAFEDRRTALLYQVKSDDADILAKDCKLPKSSSRADGTYHASGPGAEHLMSVKQWLCMDMGDEYCDTWHQGVEAVERITVRPILDHGLTELKPDTSMPLICMGDALRNIGLGGGGNYAMRDVVQVMQVLLSANRFNPETGRLIDIAALRKFEQDSLESKNNFVQKRDAMIVNLATPAPKGSGRHVDSLSDFTSSGFLRQIVRLVSFVSLRFFNPVTSGSTKERSTAVRSEVKRWMVLDRP